MERCYGSTKYTNVQAFMIRVQGTWGRVWGLRQPPRRRRSLVTSWPVPSLLSNAIREGEDDSNISRRRHIFPLFTTTTILVLRLRYVPQSDCALGS